MAQVEVSDYVLWTKQVHGDDDLRRRLERLAPGQTISLQVNGVTGVWRKMRANEAGRYNVPGLVPLGQAKAAWGELYRRYKPQGGTVVELGLAELVVPANDTDTPSRAVWATASIAEREAAWAAFKALSKAGWRSDGPYGPREELYDRDDK